MRRFRAIWQSLWIDLDRRVRIGRILGLVFIASGFIAIGKAWDGAASINFAQGQLPYLLSGGFMGVGLIVTGVALLILSSVRSERQAITDRFDEMSRLLSRNLARLGYSSNGSGGPQVVAGSSAYHRPDCKILQGKEGLMTVSAEQAASEGLAPCRVCNPPLAPEKREASATSN